MNLVEKLIAKAEADAIKVKNAVIKAVQEVDGVILPEAAKIEPIAATVANAIVPGGGSIVQVAYGLLETVAKALDAGGAAVESNFANAGLDTAVIADVKELIPQLKAASQS